MRKLILIFLFCSALLSCAHKEIKTEGPVSQPLAPKEQKGILTLEDTKTTPDTARKVDIEEVKLPDYEPKVEKKPLKEKKPLDPTSLLTIKENITVNVEAMPLGEFIIHVIGETLKVPFITVEEVMKDRTPVTMRMESPLPPDKVLSMALGTLEKRGIVIEEKDGALYLTTDKYVPKKPVGVFVGEELVDSAQEIIQVVPLNYANPMLLEGLIREFFKGKVNLRVYPKENAIIFQGPSASIKEILEFIKTFDVPYLKRKEIIHLKVTYWQVEEFQKQLTTILEGLGFPVAKTATEPGIRFIPVKYLNSLIVVCPDEKSKGFVSEWAEKLDTPESAGAEEKAFVYTPKYSKASDLVESLKRIYTVIEKEERPPAQAQQQRPAPQIQPQVRKEGLKIASDDKRNLILIMTTPAQYKNILAYLERLDQPPKQVLIEATVAELTLKDELKYGFEWLIKNRMLEGRYTLGATFGVPSSPGLTYTFLSESEKLRVLINALATKDLVNILSSPRLMVLDNQEATIQVGTDVPVITGQVTTAEAARPEAVGVVQTIQYRSTGIILRVKPTINTEGLLTLDITQEVSEMGSNPPGISSPSILVRKINTSVVASSGESVVLGGLMSQTEGGSESKVPFLGDIPLLGEVFKSRTREKRKTELLVILTPKIVATTAEASRITDELKRKLPWLK
ncbi:MAG: type II secretion system secretin GspD [Nitrososphaerales archaeon]